MPQPRPEPTRNDSTTLSSDGRGEVPGFNRSFVERQLEVLLAQAELHEAQTAVEQSPESCLSKANADTLAVSATCPQSVTNGSRRRNRITRQKTVRAGIHPPSIDSLTIHPHL